MISSGFIINNKKVKVKKKVWCMSRFKTLLYVLLTLFLVFVIGYFIHTAKEVDKYVDEDIETSEEYFYSSEDA